MKIYHIKKVSRYLPDFEIIIPNKEFLKPLALRRDEKEAAQSEHHE